VTLSPSGGVWLTSFIRGVSSDDIAREMGRRVLILSQTAY
jgi:hypothetical protein